jgi:hypothetical protein
MQESIKRLTEAGISFDDASALRRISMTLHRWHELECGDGNDYCSYSIERGHMQDGALLYSDHGKPYMAYHRFTQPKAEYEPIPDRERGALKRLGKIMAKYPTMQAYVQGDPRGASLYIIRQGDVPEGQDVDAYYNRGIAVYK